VVGPRAAGCEVASEPAALLAALQLADTALPIGRYAHSAGLEAALAGAPDLGESDIAAFVETYVLEAAGPLDGVAVAVAQRATSRSALAELDRMVTARKLTPGARLASTACGGQLAALVPTFTQTEPMSSFAAAVRAGVSDGNVAVVHGALCRALGLSAEAAVLVELRGAASGLLSAAVRLGRLSALRAQALQHELAPAIAEAAADALLRRAEEMRSSAPEIDIHSLLHARLDARQFMT
jgi:urease accessory protein